MTANIKSDGKRSETGNWSDKGPEAAKQQARAALKSARLKFPLAGFNVSERHHHLHKHPFAKHAILPKPFNEASHEHCDETQPRVTNKRSAFRRAASPPSSAHRQQRLHLKHAARLQRHLNPPETARNPAMDPGSPAGLDRVHSRRPHDS